jgi:hypothetical protein
MHPFFRLRAPLLMGSLLSIALFSPSGDAAPTTPPQRWIAETPDKMIDRAKVRATAENAKEQEILASIAIIADLSDSAAHGAAVAALTEIAATPSSAANAPKEARAEAAVVARLLSDDEGSASAAGFDTALGIVNATSIIGPFRDTGGGLARREGPEAKDEKFSNAEANYSWGSIDVHWRQATSDAEGLPLDLWIDPRKESCSIVAASVKLDKETTFVVRLAATGSARLSIDGVDAGSSEEANSSALFERLAAKADRAAAGVHLISAKVCTGALPDDGRVRLRITDEKGDALHLPTSATPVDPMPKTRVVKMTTPLTRTLAAKGDVDTLIASAILRTLAGADDDRSPRAPGLLDSIEHGLKPDDIDRLALAGWLAPSGANRSGWLNEARNSAEKAGDQEIVAFCTRRLAASRLSAKMADWAQATLASGSLATAHDDEAVTLRAQIKIALNAEVLRIEALHDLEAAADADQDKVSSDLLEELANVSSSLDPGRESASRARLSKRGVKDNAYVASIRDSKQAVAAANDAFASGLDDADEATDIVNTVLANGEAKAAKALILPLVSLAPNRADVWTTVADVLAASPRNAKEDAQMQVALQRARELAPGDARTKGVLSLLDKDKTTEAGDEHYLVPSQTVLANRKGAPAPGTAPDVADRELYWLRAVVMHKDKRVSQLIQYAREIVIAPRTQDELVEELPAEGDLTEILRARVHRKNGGTAFPTEEHDEGSRPRVKWPDLQPGDVVEVAIRTWTAGAVGGRGDPPFYFIDYAGAPSTHPLLYNEVDIETPKEHPLFVDVLHGAPDKKEEKDVGANHVVRLVWTAPKVVAEEPLSPAMSEIVPVILGSTFQTWNDFRAWYTEAVRGFTEPDDEVRRLAAELTKGKNSREDKVRAIFNFVSDDIRYVNYTSGEWWLPNRPQQLLARREGDCDDKAMLLITLLKSIGITAEEVMVQTRETAQPSILRSQHVAAPMFDHGIAFLPGIQLGPWATPAGTFLDATSPESRLGPLPSMDSRAVALKMDAGPAEIVSMPASSPAENGSTVNWTITLKADGSGDLAGEEEHTGDGAFWLRTFLTEEGARQEYVRDNLLGGWFPSIDVDKQIDFKGDLPGGRAIVKYKAHASVIARHEDSDLFVPLSPSATMMSQLAPLVTRTLPVSLPPQLAPSHQTRIIKLIAPPGFSWGPLPAKGDVAGGDFGSAHLEVTRDARDPRAIVISRSVILDRSEITVDKYAAWRSFLQQIDALMHKGVRLVPASEKGGAK